MKRFTIIVAATAPLLAAPLLAGPPVKRPYCQIVRTGVRDARRIEPCRKAPIPPVVDPTPMFLMFTAGLQGPESDLS